MSNNLLNQGFFDHLEELRNCLIKSLIAVIIAAFVFYSQVDTILGWLIKPVGKIVFTAPAEAFMARLTLTFLGGLLLASPYVIYQVWQFVATGLKENEHKMIVVYAPFSIGMFLVGVTFAYFIILPIALHFLLGYGSPTLVPMITVKNYIAFVGSLLLAFGVLFETPLVLMFLTKIGIATPAFLIQKRRHAIVLIVILSAFITPPDVFTLLLLAGPLLILYEIGIVFSKISYRQQETNS